MLRYIIGAVAVVLMMPLAGCDGNTSSLEPGKISLVLTDDEGDYTQAIITIERIELLGSGPPLILMDTPLPPTDLLTLSNTIATLVEDATVPGGVYSEIRIVIPEACMSIAYGVDGLSDDHVYASTGFDECLGQVYGGLQLPSYAESGLKVKLPGGSVEIDGDSKILMLDFDVAESFGQIAGSSGHWVMTPVIHAEYIELSGSIVVELTERDGVDLSTLGHSLADFQARLSTETEPQIFTGPDADGVFTATFRYLMPNQMHDVSVELREGVATYDFTADPMSHSVTLGSGEERTVAFQVISASGGMAAPTAVDDTWDFPAERSLIVVTNDDLGEPEAQLTSFGGGSVPGDVGSNLAGVSALLTGVGGFGFIQSSEDGTFSFPTAPPPPGVYTFQYRISNSHGMSDATVTLTVQ